MMDKKNLGIESIQKSLLRLKLGGLSLKLQEVLAAAKAARLTATETLAYALAVEVEKHEQNRITVGLNVARFPRVCTLEDFDFDVQTSLDHSQIRDLARLEWIENKQNVLFLGPPGVGKTHLAIALGRRAVEHGHSVVFISAAELMRQLEQANNDGSLDKKIAQYIKPKLLIIDEIGYLPVKATVAYLFFQLVSARYERSSMILTSNRPVGEWGLVFGDPTATTAILDRVLHHSEVVTIRGESYRLLEKRRAGLFNSADSNKKSC